MGCRAHLPNGMCFLTNTCNGTNKTCSTTGIARKPPTIGVFLCFPLMLTHAEHEHTMFGVFSCSASFLHPRCTPLHPATHAEHEETHSMVSVHAWRHSFIHQCTLNTKTHQHWCVFAFSTFLHPPMHAEYEETPTMVSLRTRCLFGPFLHDLRGITSLSSTLSTPQKGLPLRMPYIDIYIFKYILQFNIFYFSKPADKLMGSDGHGFHYSCGLTGTGVKGTGAGYFH